MKEKSGKSQKSKTSTEKSKTIRRAEPTGFDFEQAGRAFKALKKYEKKSKESQSMSSSGENGQKSELFDDNRPIFVDLVMKKYPIHAKPVDYINIFLPHPFHDPKTATSCIFVRDLDKYPRREQDREKSQKIYKQFFDEMQNLDEYTQVLSVSQLLTDYKTYEDRNKLCHAYDLMIADKRLKGQITRWLGKAFVQTKKVPFLIDVTKNVRNSFRHVFELTRAIITPSTLKFSVKIGRSDQPVDHLVANLRSILERVAARIPGKWTNVRAGYVRMSGAPELPVYVDWDSPNEIKFPQRVKRKIGFVEDEVNTVGKDYTDENGEGRERPAPKVRVYSDGRVRVKGDEDFGSKKVKRETNGEVKTEK
jgi:hypothetical protein